MAAENARLDDRRVEARLASMRPRRMAAENLHGRGDLRADRRRASMRPRRMAAENHRGAVSRG